MICALVMGRLSSGAAARRLSFPDSFFLSPWARLLAPAALVYGAAARMRRRRLRARSVSLGVPVISVGNITAGGTGKTPVVELIAAELERLGRRPAILSRGYGGGLAPSDGAGAGTGRRVIVVYLVLRRRLPEVAHFQHPDRVRAGRRAIEAGASALVLDDGFQHVRLRRDLDIVLVDAINPFGFGRVLPAGLLREPLDVLGEAGLIAITRGALVSPRKLGVVRSYLAARFRGIPRVEVDFVPRRWRSLDGDIEEPLDIHRGAPVAALAAIGNPEAFRRQLEALGLRIAAWFPFADHHRYTREEIDSVDEQARRLGARLVVTTLKDAVKIPWRAGDAAWRFLDIEPRVVRGEEVFRSCLESVL